jgi:hypothetical protein
MLRHVAILPCCAASFAALAIGANAAPAGRAIAELNAQRAANGIPAGITENRTWSKDCAEHDHYMALNRALSADEVPAAPGYTPGGAFAAGNSVLIEAGNWDAGDPYENAPVHLDQLLAPRLLISGSADADGFSCTTTFPGWTRPAPAALTVDTYPGNHASITANETALEQPWTPGELVGLPASARTGPYLIVLVDAPRESPLDNAAGLSGATLVGPGGSVAVKTVDGNTAVPSGPRSRLYPYISPGGFIIPVAPLVPGAKYSAHVVVSFAGVQTTHNWSFTAIGVNPVSRLSVTESSVTFRSRSPASVHVSFTRPGAIHAPSVTLAPGQRARLHLGPGTWQVCGAQPRANGFSAYQGCQVLVVIGVPVLRLIGPDLTGPGLAFALRFSPVLHGHAATLTVTPLTYTCLATGCSAAPGPPTVRSIVLRQMTLSFRLPRVGHGIRVSISTPAFQRGDAPWNGAHATNSFVRH